MRLVFHKRTYDGLCSICGRAGASMKVDDGQLCRFCVPTTYSFGKLTVKDVFSNQIQDSEMRGRVDIFHSTKEFGILLFDENNHLMMKGEYPNYHLPIMKFDEIKGYSINGNGEPLAYNEVDGKRCVFPSTSNDFLKNIIRKYDDIELEIQFTRKNVIFRKYSLLSFKSRLLDDKIETMKEIVKLSSLLDEIVEYNCSEGNIL